MDSISVCNVEEVPSRRSAKVYVIDGIAAICHPCLAVWRLRGWLRWGDVLLKREWFLEL